MGSYCRKYYVCLVIGLILAIFAAIGFANAAKVTDALAKSESFTLVIYDANRVPHAPSASEILKQANETFTDRGATALGMSEFGLFTAMYRIWIGAPAALFLLIGVVGIIKNRKYDMA